MMSDSPLPPDPYEALGISKDEDIETIKKIYRKLVLKYHPDRIKDPTLVEEGKNQFTRVQGAWELLSDPDKRARYDKEVRLAELRRERLMNDAVRAFSSSNTFSPRSTPLRTEPVGTPRRETRAEPRFTYEDRTPDSYFDLPARHPGIYEEPLPRANARKADASYDRERKTSAAKANEKKEKEKAKAPGISARMTTRLKEYAVHAKEETRQKHAKSAKSRDQEERKERLHKRSESSQQYSPYVQDYSDSDSDTVVSRSRDRPRERANTTRPRRTLSPEPMRRRETSPRGGRGSYEDDDRDSQDAWEERHGRAAEYIAKAMKRPEMVRQGSDAYIYRSRREGSGSDSDKRPSSAHRSHRDYLAEEHKARPGMTTFSSAPSGLRSMVNEDGERAAPQTRNSWSSKDKDVPLREGGLKRQSSAPVSPPSMPRRETVARGSNLKQFETTHDSGYGSGSASHTPEMREESPPTPPARPTLARETTSTRYRVGKGDDGRPTMKAMPSMSRHLNPEMMTMHDQYTPSVIGVDSRPRRESPRRRGESKDDNRERERDRDRDRYRPSSRTRGRSPEEERRERRGSRERGGSSDRRRSDKMEKGERRPSKTRLEPESRSRTTTTTTKTGGHSGGEGRPSASRTESARYESRTDKLYGELPSHTRDRAGGGPSNLRTVDTANVKTSKHREPVRTQYPSPTSYRPYDFDDRGSNVSSIRPSVAPRRGSVY